MDAGTKGEFEFRSFTTAQRGVLSPEVVVPSFFQVMGPWKRDGPVFIFFCPQRVSPLCPPKPAVSKAPRFFSFLHPTLWVSPPQDGFGTLGMERHTGALAFNIHGPNRNCGNSRAGIGRFQGFGFVIRRVIGNGFQLFARPHWEGAQFPPYHPGRESLRAPSSGGRRTFSPGSVVWPHPRHIKHKLHWKS